MQLVRPAEVVGCVRMQYRMYAPQSKQQTSKYMFTTYIYIYIYVYSPLHIYIYIHLANTCTANIYIYAYIYIYMYVYIYIYANMNIHIYNKIYVPYAIPSLLTYVNYNLATVDTQTILLSNLFRPEVVNASFQHLPQRKVSCKGRQSRIS